jgi:cysteine desulfurase
MLPYFTEEFGNPHSSSHCYGRGARDAIEMARLDVAALIGARAGEIVFTSGATESDNLALKGALTAPRRRGNHIVTVATEHRAVLDVCRRLEAGGTAVTYLPVSHAGLLDLEQLESAIRPETTLVSVMAANNEIGVIQPLGEIGAICRRHGALFHTDAAQAVGKIALDVEAMNIDLLSISGHKIYGPKGIGALYVRSRPRTRIVGQMDGGGQERGLRAGTLPTPLCVGLGEACRLALLESQDEAVRLTGLREHLLDGLRVAIPEIRVNGDLGRRLPGNLNVSFLGIETTGLLADLRSIAVASGSACSSGDTAPSHVLEALGVDTDSWASIRLGLGRFTTNEDIDRAIEDIARAVARLRDLSPLWDMHMNGVDLNAYDWPAF